MNNDLISRLELKKAINKVVDEEIEIDEKWAKGLKYSLKLIDNATTVDLKDIYQEGHYDGHLEGYTKAINEERPQGEWIPEENTFTDLNGIIETYTRFQCSVCNQGQNFGEYPFCCWCGAKMEGIKS